jgi:polyisoprenoid-binding protein YceI
MRLVFSLLAASSLTLGVTLCGCSPAAVENAEGDVTTDSGGDAEVVAVEEAMDADDSVPAGETPTESETGDTDTPAATTDAPETTETPAKEAPATIDEPAASAATEPAADLTPVPVTDGVAALSADNTKIQFTGTHVGDKPDPRVGTFGKFSGEAKVDAEAKTLQSVTVEIDTTSITTGFQKLTDHLQSPDFLEVQEYPTAKFESTEIAAADGGQVTIKGNLTLHGVTKEISFPATVEVSDEGLTVHSDFSINRSEFGMDFSTDKVDDKVALSVVVGEKTPTP